MNQALLALASTDLGVSTTLVNLILAVTFVILIGIPIYLVTSSRGGSSNSLADY